MHRHTSRAATVAISILAVAIALAAIGIVRAVKTDRVEFGLEGAYDDAVYVQRNETGCLLFRDTQVTTPVTLGELSSRSTIADHGTLAGLDEDDHPQYLNTLRHNLAHNMPYNSQLLIPTDVDGNTRLGEHVADTDIHIDRNVPQTVYANWTFAARPDCQDGLELSVAGEAGNSALHFRSTDPGAAFTFDDYNNRFDINRPVLAQGDFEIDTGDLTVKRADTLAALILKSNDDTPSPNQTFASILFMGKNDIGSPLLYGALRARIVDPNAGAEHSVLALDVRTTSGLSQERLRIHANGAIVSGDLDVSNALSASRLAVAGVGYPTGDGTTSQVLTTDGAGAAIWADAPTHGTGGLSISGADNRLVRLDGTDGIQDGDATLSDDGDLDVGRDIIANRQVAIYRHGDSASGPLLQSYMSRGTEETPASVQDDDRLFAYLIKGYVSAATAQQAAGILVYVDGTPGATDMPGRMVFQTTPDGSATPQDRLTIYNDGSIEVPAVYGQAVGGTNKDLYIDSNGKIGYLSSSRRVKDNIRDLPAEDAARVLALRPVKYDRPAQGITGENGLIAEDVAEVYPEAVGYSIEFAEQTEAVVLPDSTTSSTTRRVARRGPPDSVNYAMLVVPLLSQVQRHRARIEALEAQVQGVEARIEALEAGSR